MNRHESRIARLRAVLAEEGVDAAVLVGRENTRYLCGFSGSESVLVVDRERVRLVIDFRYLSQAAEQCPGCEIVDGTVDRHGVLASVLSSNGCRSVGLEDEETSWAFQRRILSSVPEMATAPLRGRVTALRQRKEEGELDSIRRAVAIADRVMEHAWGFMAPGMTENEVAGRIEATMRTFGADGPSFQTIVASGPRSALPHGIASDRILQAGDPVVLDFGCKVDGYCSDLTRTVFLGTPDPGIDRVYRIVLESQKAGISALRAGRPGRDVDAAARGVIEAEGYGDRFGHGLGHGVGLAIHEDPRLSRTYEGILETGNVVTVEPGIYLPGFGGVRIEDMAVVTEDGCRILTAVTKERTIL